MKTALLTFATLAALTSFASAESIDGSEGTTVHHAGYLSLGLEAGAQRDAKAGVVLDGGLRLSTSPFYLHARSTFGMSGSVAPTIRAASVSKHESAAV